MLKILTLCVAGFEAAEVAPKLFVLMGNFQSDAGAANSAGFAAIRENFNALAALLRTFRRIRVGSSGSNNAARTFVLDKLLFIGTCSSNRNAALQPSSASVM